MESLQDLRKYSYCAVNLVLAAVQILVFILCTATGNKMYIAGRCGTDLVLAQGQYWRLLTSVFLHAGLSHLGSNLLVQILMGNAVERNLGHIRYLALYLLSGIGGNVISVLYDRAQGVNIYSVGASGAVFGVMGTLFVLIIRGRKKLRSGSSLLTRAAFAVFYAVYSGFRNPYTDNAAHLGGLAFGVVLGVLLTAGLEDVDLRDLR
ncbi:MAG: rhomboid family intramembrane serine protease [Oscillospiraceae bacterium]|jgi:rhomboid protease GluP|nr:rhomboid family intramembrane serine protease [Lachnospiraceae bacterium]MBQ4000130.1 rhomboid family intramembrane serine protease [Oscillospiraceae bacterium]